MKISSSSTVWQKTINQLPCQDTNAHLHYDDYNYLNFYEEINLNKRNSLNTIKKVKQMTSYSQGRCSNGDMGMDAASRQGMESRI